MQRRHLFLLVGIASLALGAGLLLGRGVYRAAAPELHATTLLPSPRALPEFTLATSTGALAAHDLAGRWTLLFFGFTRCADVCPTTLALLARVDAALAAVPAAQRPRVLFVSVDPGRDTPAISGAYAARFDAAFLGATGTDAELVALTTALGAPFAKLGSGDDYEVDHSGALFLLDRDARFAGVITPPLDATPIATDLAQLVSRD